MQRGRARGGEGEGAVVPAPMLRPSQKKKMTTCEHSEIVVCVNCLGGNPSTIVKCNVSHEPRRVEDFSLARRAMNDALSRPSYSHGTHHLKKTTAGDVPRGMYVESNGGAAVTAAAASRGDRGGRRAWRGSGGSSAGRSFHESPREESGPSGFG